MTLLPVFGSTLGQIFAPVFEALAWILAFFYALVPNYVFAIAMLTLTIMVLTAPLTVKSTRSMFAMQRLQPQMKKLQQQYKGDRVALNEEMMKLYRENHVNPAGGCLPMLLQFPIFICLYDVIRGLTNTVTVRGHLQAAPHYIAATTRLAHDLKAHPGQMKAFGLNLASSLFSHHTLVGYLPYGGMVAAAIALQYLQMRQMNSRNPAAAQANPQMQAVQKYMPLIFAIIYLRIAAGVNVYFIVSAASRIGIQEWVFRSGMLDRAPRKAVAAGGGRRSLMERIAAAQQRALEQQRLTQAGQGPATPNAPSASNNGSRASRPASPGRLGSNGSVGRSSPPGAAPGRAPGATRPAGASSGNGRAPGQAGSGSPATSSARPRTGTSRPLEARSAAVEAQATPKPHPRSKTKKPRKTR